MAKQGLRPINFTMSPVDAEMDWYETGRRHGETAVHLGLREWEPDAHQHPEGILCEDCRTAHAIIFAYRRRELLRDADSIPLKGG